MTRFIVGRYIAGIRHDLEDCPRRETLPEAVKEMVQRIVAFNDAANFLQVLEAEVDDRDNLIHYSVVPSGRVVAALLELLPEP